MSRRKKVLVIGLDCAPPELIFDQWRDALPNFKRAMDDGVWGKLESCIPAITVPAWSSMMSSKDPGTLGFYGFRNRGDYSYDTYTLANAHSVKTDRVWDVLSHAGKKVITVGVPQTYPPKPVNGIQIGCFLSPSTKNPAKPYTYPSSAMKEIEAIVGEYLVDVPNFRTEDIVIKHDPDAHEGPGGRELTGLQLMDIAPTILEQFGIPVPADMQGKVF